MVLDGPSRPTRLGLVVQAIPNRKKRIIIIYIWFGGAGPDLRVPGLGPLNLGCPVEVRTVHWGIPFLCLGYSILIGVA